MKKSNLLYALPAIAFLACSKDSIEDYTETGISEPVTEYAQGEDQVELASPDKRGTVLDVYFAGQKMPVENIDGNYIYQGDIMFSPDMITTQDVKLVFEEGEEIPAQKSVGRTSGRWPDNTVYYAIDSRLTNQERVTEAIKHWESKTNVKFVQRSSQSNYVYFTPGSGCSSYVGMIGGKQNITLSTACSTGSTIHEIGHAIGLWHEQSRVDRDRHVTINYTNIKSGMEHNFKTYQEQGFDGDEFTSNLDFGSIMMYGPYSFSSNGQPTITRTDGSVYSVQRSGLSSGDVEGVNSMYPGSTSTTPVEPVYVNGETYVVHGLKVLRYYDRWYYYTRYGWRTVVYENGTWRYVF